MPSTLPYGSWPSPIDAASVSAASPRIDGARFVGDEVWWGVSVPEEAGRTAVRRRRPDGSIEDVLPDPGNARSRVHEYGGGSWAATDDGDLVYVDKNSQRVMRRDVDGAEHALTPGDAGMRFGGLTVQHGHLLAVRETHGEVGAPRRDIAVIPLNGSASDDPGALTITGHGSDFVAHPALSPDGGTLAWIAWDHPAMPWDRTVLLTAPLGSDRAAARVVAGATGTAPLQPQWRGARTLVYADDPTGRWNLWQSSMNGSPAPLAPADADTGGPVWVLGTRWFATLDDGRIVAIRTDGGDEIVLIDGESVTPLPLPVVASAGIEDHRGTRVLVSGSTAEGRSGVWSVDVDSGDVSLVTGSTRAWGDEWMPRARAVTVDGPHGPVYAYAYAPTNPDVVGPDDERPPYVALVHGGPTAQVGPAPSAKIAYYTSRGIGVLDVNYGGSTGYGRDYRERLLGQWGVVDVADVAAAARGIAAMGLADPDRLGIAGGSAGGWTVLAALARTDVFSAGISRYGVADARALAQDTHDFEARYLDGLIGPLPEAEDVYIERSPLSHVDGFTAPLLILQGAEDPVVPLSQAEAIRRALADRGIPHAFIVYPGEGHGFRRAETIVHSLESELAFLGQTWGFATPGLPDVPMRTA